jgi:small conductance mechanosensitive channel
MIWTWSAAFLPRFVTALIILLAGALVARWASSLARRIAERTGRVDPTVQPIMGSSVRYSILILVVVVALSQLGVQTASLLAVLGAAGLAIGLALQGTLSNIAAGIMLLFLRPFHVGDYIEVISGNPISGTVKEIGLFACLIESYDGALVFAPNSTIWSNALRNHSHKGGRLFIISVGFSEKVDLERAKAILIETISSATGVLRTPPPYIFVDRLDGSNVSLTCGLWAAPEDIGSLQRSMIGEAKRRLEAAGADSLSPTHIMRIVPPDADPSRFTTSTNLATVGQLQRSASDTCDHPRPRSRL